MRSLSNPNTTDNIDHTSRKILILEYVPDGVAKPLASVASMHLHGKISITLQPTEETWLSHLRTIIHLLSNAYINC